MEDSLCGGAPVWRVSLCGAEAPVWRGPCVELRTLYGGAPVWRVHCVEGPLCGAEDPVWRGPCVEGPLCGADALCEGPPVWRGPWFNTDSTAVHDLTNALDK